MKTIRLIYPQWQGGNIARWIPNIPAEDASRGYCLGAMLLNFLAPETSYQTFTVPVSTEISERICYQIEDYAVPATFDITCIN